MKMAKTVVFDKYKKYPFVVQIKEEDPVQTHRKMIASWYILIFCFDLFSSMYILQLNFMFY